MSTVHHYRAAVGRLHQAVHADYRDEAFDAHVDGDAPLVLDPHQMRPGLAALIELVDLAHGALAGIAGQIRAVRAGGANDGVWLFAEPISDQDVATSGDPTEFHKRQPTWTRAEIAAAGLDTVAEQAQLDALYAAAQIGEAGPVLRDLLTKLRSLTSREAYDRVSGQTVNCYLGHTGWWTSARIQDIETGRFRTELVAEVPEEQVSFRPLPVEPRGSELDDPEPDVWTNVLDLDGPLPDPADHGWLLEPQRTHPAGASEPSYEEGLSRTWHSCAGHELRIFQTSPTRYSRIQYDNHGVPLLKDLLVLLITQGAHR